MPIAAQAQGGYCGACGGGRGGRERVGVHVRVPAAASAFLSLLLLPSPSSCGSDAATTLVARALTSGPFAGPDWVDARVREFGLSLAPVTLATEQATPGRAGTRSSAPRRGPASLQQAAEPVSEAAKLAVSASLYLRSQSPENQMSCPHPCPPPTFRQPRITASHSTLEAILGCLATSRRAPSPIFTPAPGEAENSPKAFASRPQFPERGPG